MFCRPQFFGDVLQTQHALYNGILELRGRVCVTVLLYGASYHWADFPLLLYRFKLVKTLGVSWLLSRWLLCHSSYHRTGDCEPVGSLWH